MRPLGRGTLGMSAGCHAAALTLIFWGLPALRDDPVRYEVIRVEVVSPPPAPAPETEEETPPPAEDKLVVETPDDPPREPPLEETVEEPEPEPVPELPEPVPELPEPEPELPEPEPELPEPEPEPEQPEPEPEPEQPEPEPEPGQPEPEQPEPEPAPADPPQETPPPSAEAVRPDSSSETDAEEGGEDINVRQQGLQRDFSEYWSNLIRQMKRCFRPERRLAATVRFVVQRDGSTTDIGISKSSGSFAFDLDAMGAAECIGKAQRLGPLPDELPWDSVPVEIELSPPGRRGGP